MTKQIYPRFSLAIFFCIILSEAGSLTVISVGDIMMGSTYPVENIPPDQGRGLLVDLDSLCGDADLILGNLEGTLGEGGVCTKKVKKGTCYAFRSPVGFTQNLVAAGFDFVNLANNHMNDFGESGISTTMASLDSAGIEYGGAYGKTGSFMIDSLSVGVACFATSPNAPKIFDLAAAQRIVAAVARDHDIVIVSFHGGGEGLRFMHVRDTMEYFLGSPRGNVVKFAHAVIDSGADYVWGHGPHVPRALELYKERVIAYSLGNFCTWGFNVQEERGYAPILKITVDSVGTFMTGQIISALQRSRQPLIIDSLHRAARLISALSREDFPESPLMISEQGSVTIKAPNIEQQ